MLNFENEGNLVAIIVNKDKDKNKNEKKLYVSPDSGSVKSGGVSFTCDINETV
jgi:hypothetical protein